ncbi:hypothetical protein CRENPOLYSF2_2400025 [Crenothrix polyspora]|uniref:Uncharacterized protein n=1 Tax=Crenothrix polyspora TaxID=360316 RepID=A0A1R4H6L8_9GAMM|nr:hypothetical protein CRENPOLYSF2_2400025 [Crenothrix polyspora]
MFYRLHLSAKMLGQSIKTNFFYNFPGKNYDFCSHRKLYQM